jgi:pimeloyl-ACP methyl ester carboxylesterase
MAALHHVEHGAGTPVLALHGWTVDHRIMTGCLEPLFGMRPGYRRIYPDLPGMGKSPAPESMASSDDLLQAVLDFLDEVVGDADFLLVGESFGGYLARAVAAARPGQVAGLALICSVGAAVEFAGRTLPATAVLRPDPDLIASLDPDEAQEYADVAVVQSPETLRRFRAEVAPGLAQFDQPATDRMQQRRLLSTDPEAGAPFERPSLILAGRQDDNVGYADQYVLLPHYPRATFAVLDVAGHNLQIEQPELFEALVGEWLDRVEAEAAEYA